MKTKTGLRLRAAREASGLSLAALSSKMNSLLSASRISNYEQGTRQMSVDGAISLGKALDVAPSYLLGLDEDINETPQLVGKFRKSLDCYMLIWMTLNTVQYFFRFIFTKLYH